MNLTARKLPPVFLLMAALTALLLVAAACGGGDDEAVGTKTPAGTTGAATQPPAGGGEVTLDISMGDNFFELDGERNPTLKIPAGAEVTINLTNAGAAIHNMRFAGDDNKYNSNDDAVSDPQLVNPGGTATLTFTAPGVPGTYVYQCDFHATDMKGEIDVQ